MNDFKTFERFNRIEEEKYLELIKKRGQLTDQGFQQCQERFR